MAAVHPARIGHDLPAPAIEVVPAILADRLTHAVARAEAIAITDDASLSEANAAVIDLHQLDKELTAHGERIKKPLNGLLKAVRECLDNSTIPVLEAKRSLQSKIAAHQRKLQEEADRIRSEAEEQARKAREAAEKERARLQAEADAKHAAEVAAARAKAEAEAKELEALMGAPVAPEPVTVQPAPVVVVPPPPVAIPIISPPPKSPVQVRKVQRVEITNAEAVPVAVGGKTLRPIDERAVMDLLKAGIEVPGARLIEVEQLAMGRA